MMKSMTRTILSKVPAVQLGLSSIQNVNVENINEKLSHHNSEIRLKSNFNLETKG
ncbi:hypothetical protein Mapa_013839 [Marchantia paleacea]|nr:hypothetical protein Mapa_013839 [Marchantia paleacea]